MKKSSASYLIKILVGAFFLFGFGFLPAVEPITPVGMRVIGIFIGTIWLVATVNPAWPAILCVALMGTTPLYSMNEAIAASYGNWITPFLMGIFILGYALTKSGIANRFVRWIMSRPSLKGRPWMFTSAFLFSIIIIGYLMDCFALIGFYLGCVEIIANQLGYEKKSRYTTGLSIGVGFMIAIVGASTPFQSHVTLVLGSYANYAGVTIPAFTYIAWGIIPMLLVFAAYMLIFRFIIRPDVSNFYRAEGEIMQAESTPMSPEQKSILAIYAAVIILWLLPGVLQLVGVAPSLVATLNKLGLVFPAFVGIALMSVIRVAGKPLLDFKEAASKIAWPIVVLVNCNMLLGNAITREEVGFTLWFQQVFEPLLEGLPPMVFVMAVVVIALIMTNVGSNSVAAVIAFQMAVLLVPENVNLAVVAVLIAFTVRAAFVLPSSCVSVAAVYGDAYTDTKKILPLGLLLCVAVVVILAVVGYPLAQIFVG